MKRSTPIGRWRAEWLEVTSSGRFLRYECVDTPRQLKRIVAQLALGGRPEFLDRHDHPVACQGVTVDAPTAPIEGQETPRARRIGG